MSYYILIARLIYFDVFF